MPMTVQNLIDELQKIENKELEVECYSPNNVNFYIPFRGVRPSVNRKKVLILEETIK